MLQKTYYIWSYILFIYLAILPSFTTAAANASSSNDTTAVFDVPIKNPDPLRKDLLDGRTKLCMRCSSTFGGEITESKNLTISQRYVRLEAQSYGCNVSDYDVLKTIEFSTTDELHVVMNRGVCEFSARSHIADSINNSPDYNGLKISGILLLSPDDSPLQGPVRSSNDTVDSGVLMCTLSLTYYERFIKTGPTEFSPFKLYQLSEYDNLTPSSRSLLNSEVIIIFSIALGCMIGISCYVKELESFKRREQAQQERANKEGNQGQEQRPQLAEGEDVEEVTMKRSLFMVVYASVFLVVLFFLYKWLVWVIIGLFVFMGGVTFLLLAFNLSVMFCPRLTGEQPSFDFKCLGQCQLFDLIFLSIGLTIGIVWCIFRHSSWAWILQDFMGITFCITVPSQIRINNLKITSFLFFIFFLYDIFMVFVTPLLKPVTQGKSIMVEVATGAGTGEYIPMLFKVPKFPATTFMASCQPEGSYSMLGFGDVIVPAIMTVLCVRFDLMWPVGRKKFWKTYTFWSIVSYSAGLVTCFAALFIMGIGQPALLYINPFMVVTICVLASLRSEFKMFWNHGLKCKELRHSRIYKWQCCVENGETQPMITQNSSSSANNSRNVSSD